MSQTPPDVRTANILYLVFWVLLTASILLLRKRVHRLRGFRERMLANWRPSLVIALLFVISMGLAGGGFFNLARHHPVLPGTDRADACQWDGGL